MFDVGFGELLLIVLVILLLFGPQKLPEISRTVAKGIAQVRKAQAEFHRNLNLISEEIQRATDEASSSGVSSSSSTTSLQSNGHPSSPSPSGSEHTTR